MDAKISRTSSRTSAAAVCVVWRKTASPHCRRSRRLGASGIGASAAVMARPVQEERWSDRVEKGGGEAIAALHILRCYPGEIEWGGRRLPRPLLFLPGAWLLDRFPLDHDL